MEGAGTMIRWKWMPTVGALFLLSMLDGCDFLGPEESEPLLEERCIFTVQEAGEDGMPSLHQGCFLGPCEAIPFSTVDRSSFMDLEETSGCADPFPLPGTVCPGGHPEAWYNESDCGVSPACLPHERSCQFQSPRVTLPTGEYMNYSACRPMFGEPVYDDLEDVELTGKDADEADCAGMGGILWEESCVFHHYNIMCSDGMLYREEEACENLGLSPAGTVLFEVDADIYANPEWYDPSYLDSGCFYRNSIVNDGTYGSESGSDGGLSGGEWDEGGSGGEESGGAGSGGCGLEGLLIGKVFSTVGSGAEHTRIVRMQGGVPVEFCHYMKSVPGDATPCEQADVYPLSVSGNRLTDGFPQQNKGPDGMCTGYIILPEFEETEASWTCGGAVTVDWEGAEPWTETFQAGTLPTGASALCGFE